MVKQRITLRDAAIYFDDTQVGGAEELTATVSRGLAEAYEAGSDFPIELVGGQVTVSGSITRAFIDVDLLNLVAPSTTGQWPSFTIVGTVTSGKTPGRTIAFLGAELESFDINGWNLTDYAKNALSFRALGWRFTS